MQEHSQVSEAIIVLLLTLPIIAIFWEIAVWVLSNIKAALFVAAIGLAGCGVGTLMLWGLG